jgi:cobalamin biosynthesis Mg chelatase CobN
VFSPAPGAYSPSIQFLAKSGDQRGDESRMAELFTNRMSHAYGDGL